MKTFLPGRREKFSLKKEIKNKDAENEDSVVGSEVTKISHSIFCSVVFNLSGFNIVVLILKPSRILRYLPIPSKF